MSHYFRWIVLEVFENGIYVPKSSLILFAWLKGGLGARDGFKLEILEKLTLKFI